MLFNWKTRREHQKSVPTQASQQLFLQPDLEEDFLTGQLAIFILPSAF